MKTMTVTNRESSKAATYNLNEVKNIEHGQMKDFYSYPDIYGNGYQPQDSCIKINFTDTTTATFGKDWVISFE